MHTSTYTRMKWFVESYEYHVKKQVVEGSPVRVLDIGGSNVNGSYRALFENDIYLYEALDIEKSDNVDIVPGDAYSWIEIKDDTYDIVISGSTFEHIEYIWLTIREIERVLKPGGLCCIIAPNGLGEHRYPYDCWRFYGDGLRALSKWSGMSDLHVSIAGIPDASAGEEWDSHWNDAMLIAQKRGGNDIADPPQLPMERRIELDYKKHYEIMSDWMYLKLSGQSLGNYFQRKHIESIGIYGAGIVGKLMVMELRDTKCKVQFFVDRFETNKSIGHLRCYSLDEDVKYSEVDCMVVSTLRDISIKELKDSMDQEVPVLYISDIIGELYGQAVRVEK